MAHSIGTLNIMTQSIMALSIMTFNIITLSTLREREREMDREREREREIACMGTARNDTQHKHQVSLDHFYCYAEYN
jgi:hypothetical protein